MEKEQFGSSQRVYVKPALERKKMNGYIIEAYNNMGNAYTCRRLLEEGKKRNMDVKMIGVHDVSVRQEGVF